MRLTSLLIVIVFAVTFGCNSTNENGNTRTAKEMRNYAKNEQETEEEEYYVGYSYYPQPYIFKTRGKIFVAKKTR